MATVFSPDENPCDCGGISRPDELPTPPTAAPQKCCHLKMRLSREEAFFSPPKTLLLKGQIVMPFFSCTCPLCDWPQTVQWKSFNFPRQRPDLDKFPPHSFFCSIFFLLLLRFDRLASFQKIFPGRVGVQEAQDFRFNSASSTLHFSFSFETYNFM